MVRDVFSLEQVDYSYGEIAQVFRDLTLTFRQNERTVILGANGTGKSTLLALLDGLIFPHAGRIRAFGRTLSEQTLGEQTFNRDFRRRVAFVFQNSDVQLFSSTVWDEIAFGPLQLGYPSSRVSEQVEGLLEALNIQDLRSRAPHALSDGQKKKVAIASSLATNPDVLLLDEPTSGLDPRTQVWLIELMEDLHQQGKTIISATHDLAIAMDIADRAIVLSEDQSVAADGRYRDIIENEDLLLQVNLIHEHAHVHGGTKHVHRHGHFGHYHSDGGAMHDTHNHQRSHHDPARGNEQSGPDALQKLQVLLEHWIEHGDSHRENYREWAEKASGAGEEEIAREIHLAIEDDESLKKHLQRARSILAAKLVLMK